MISSSGCGSSTSACATSTCSTTAVTVSTIVVVSPWSAPCRVTATIAPVSRSIACSALWARCVRPSFIFVTFASGSDGLVQSVRGLLLSLPIEPRQVVARRGLDPRGFRQPRQKRLIAFAGIAPDDAPHGRVRLEGRRIDRYGLACEESGRDESLVHPREHRPVRLEIDQASRPRNRRMI